MPGEGVPCTSAALTKVFDVGLSVGAPNHRSIIELAKHSEWIGFLAHVRIFFLREFEKHRDDFAGIDGEALFVGTVLHSTDHAQLIHITKVDDCAGVSAEFNIVGRMNRFVRSSLTDELSLVRWMNDFRFSAASHPLFRRTYEYARTVNSRLAGEMEVAIVR